MLDETYPPDSRGGVSYSADLVGYGREHGHTVDVLTVNNTSTTVVETRPGGSTIRMGRLAELDSGRFSAALFWFLWRNMARYDIVHVNHPNPMGQVSVLTGWNQLGHYHGPRLVVTFHAEVVPAKRFARLFNALVTSPILKLAHAIIVSSPKMLSSPQIAKHQAKVHVIPFGIDLDRWRCLARTTEAAELRLKRTDELHLLFVGRLVRYKGVDVLLRAMTRAPGHLYIVGGGALRDRLEKLRDELKLNARVEFLGRVGDAALAALYSWADVLILPSVDRGEAFGYVLVEAMAHETALVTTELGTGTSWVNVGGRTGLVVPPRDPDSLASAVSMLAANRGLLDEFKKSASRRAVEMFQIERMLQETYRCYEALVSRAS